MQQFVTVERTNFQRVDAESGSEESITAERKRRALDFSCRKRDALAAGNVRIILLRIMSGCDAAERWYAVKVFYNRVFDVEHSVEADGMKSYIPLRWEVSSRGGHPVRRRVPAVSSLMFVRASENYMLNLQERFKASRPLMVYFDRETRRPAPIPDREMQTFILVTSVDDEGLEYISEPPAHDFSTGDRVRVTGGPFAGAEGYIRRIKGDRRLVVTIEGVVAVATAYIPHCFLEKVE